MDVRIEMRKKDFKKAFDDPRRRREEQQVQIRKQNREARLSSKRQAAFADIDSEDSTVATASVAHDMTNIPHMCNAIMSNDENAQLEASQYFRKLLSLEKNPPIQKVIEANVVPRLIEFLKDDSRPNLQFEAAWALTNIASGTQAQTYEVIQHGALPIFVRLLSSPKEDVREQAVWALGNIAGDCQTLRDLVLTEGGLQPLLIQLEHALATPNKESMLRNAAWTLSNLCRGKPKPQLQLIAPALPIISKLVYSSDTDVLIDSCWSLSYLSDSNSNGNDNQTNEAIEAILQTGIAPRLVQLLVHTQVNVQTPALRTVGNIVSGEEGPTQTMVANGCVPALRLLLNSPRKIIRKEACWTISNITAGTPEQIQEVIRDGLIPLLIELSYKADFEIRKEIYWALANAGSGANRIQVEYVVGVKIIAALCDVLDWQNEPKLLATALEALDNILAVGKQIKEEKQLEENPYVTLVEEAGAFPKLENLQIAPTTSRVYHFAIKIMTNYMSYEEEEEPEPEGSYQAFGSSLQDNMQFNFGGNM